MPFDQSVSRGEQPALNVLGTPLEACCHDPVTGFYRTGYCQTGPDDRGVHTVCAVMSEDFLKFTQTRGNDLSTPRPEFDFPGLRSGDHWCLCASRWLEAFEMGSAPSVKLSATHIKSLEIIPLAALQAHAINEDNET